MMNERKRRKGIILIIFTLFISAILGGCVKKSNSITTTAGLDINNNITNDTGSKNNAAIAAIVKKDELDLLNLNNDTIITLDKSGKYTHPIISADKNYIAYLNDNLLYVVNIKGEKAKVSDNISMQCYTWLDKSSIIYSPENGGLFIYDVVKKESKPYIENKYNYKDITIGTDGIIYAEKYLYYTKDGSKYMSDYGIVQFKPNGKDEQEIVKSIPANQQTLGMYPVIAGISKDSRFLYIFQHPHAASIATDGVAFAVYDIKNSKFISCENKDIITLHYKDNFSSSGVDSENIAFINGAGREMNTNKNLGILNVVTGNFQQLLPKDQAAMTPFFSDDGKTILYAASQEGKMREWKENGNHNIYSIDVTTKKIAQLTNSGKSFDFSPIYIDGKSFIFFRADLNDSVSMWKSEDGKEIKLIDELNDADHSVSDFYGHFDIYNYFDLQLGIH